MKLCPETKSFCPLGCMQGKCGLKPLPPTNEKDYDKFCQDLVVERIKGYAGKRRRDVSNPCMTARDALALADWIAALEARNADLLRALTKARGWIDSNNFDGTDTRELLVYLNEVIRTAS